jgi:hypothetical protein
MHVYSFHQVFHFHSKYLIIIMDENTREPNRKSIFRKIIKTHNKNLRNTKK